MAETGSVSTWIRSLRGGRDSAADRIWSRYKEPLEQVADSALHGAERSVADEEDVVVQAFAAFLRRTAEGAWPMLQTRDDLWRILVRVTKTFAWKQAKYLRRDKRSGPTLRAEPGAILATLADRKLPPHAVADLSETLARLLDGLRDDELRAIAIARLEGYTVPEIAAAQNRSVSTIERRVRLIRASWARVVDEESLP